MMVLARSFSHIAPTCAFAAVGVGLRELDLDHLADPDLADSAEAERAERVADRLALRVENPGLQRHCTRACISSPAWARRGCGRWCAA